MSSPDIVLGPKQLTPDKESHFANPWPWLIFGIVATSTGFLIANFMGERLTSLRALLVFAGVLAALGAVVIRPGCTLVLGGAALTAYIASWALLVEGQEKDWNSMRLVFAIAALAGIVAAGVVALPQLWRRVAVSAIIVLHFGGILTAVLAASPGPWLANVMLVSVYRPYLQFMYLTNAYHFYAPNPGPSYYFWFRVAYTKDGDANSSYWQWIKIPDMKEDGWPNYSTALRYQRRLSLAMLVAQYTESVSFLRQSEINRKHEAANLKRYKAKKPIFPVAPNRSAYAHPTTDPGTALLRSYVRRVAREFRGSNPDASITAIKVYRVEHLILDASELDRGLMPEDPQTYLPYYWGEFDALGNLTAPDDPFLYFHMPILKVRPVKPAMFASNADILKELADHFLDYLKNYLKDESEKEANGPAKAAWDARAREDLDRLLQGPTPSVADLKTFEKKHPLLAGKTGALLDAHRKKELLADIENRVSRKYDLPDDVRLLPVLEDINFLLGKHAGLALDLIRHQKTLVEEGKATVAQYLELQRILEIWATGRFRMPRDDEDHFDIAVATACNVDDMDPVILNYAYLHAGDTKWVRYPGTDKWQELRRPIEDR